MKNLMQQVRTLRWFGYLAFSMVFFILSCSSNEQQKNGIIPIIDKIISNPNLQKPTHILRFKDYYVATELKTNKLAIFDDLDLESVSHFDPKTIGKRFHSPHYMAISPQGHLLISNGWGKSIVQIEDLDGSGWKEFSGLAKDEFKAPHGICVDDKGWIYIGDSLNSRLVRFKDMEGLSWQVFKDLDRKIAYIRQLVCKNGAVWISNSYHSRPGLNPGKGSNVLRIDDFVTGKVQVVYESKHTKITGILPLDDILLVARWINFRDIEAINLRSQESVSVENSQNKLGVPYGFFEDKDENLLIAAYFGSFKANYGGLAVLKR